jgi:hypothetical protein
MLAAAAIARRGEKRGSRPRSERKAPPGEPHAGSKTREPTIAPVRGSPDHTSGDHSDSDSGSIESSSNVGPFAPIGDYGSGAGSSRGYLHESRGSFHDRFTPKPGDRAFSVYPQKGSDGADAGQLWHLRGSVADRGVGGAAKTAPLGMRDRIHGGSSAYADTSRLSHATDRAGGSSGGVGSGSAGSGLPALYVIGDTGKSIVDSNS